MPTTKQSFWRTSSRATSVGPGRDVEHRVGRAGLDAGDKEAPPARVLSEREHGSPPVVAGPERREEGARIHTLDSMALREELERIAAAAAAHGEVAGVLAAEPARGRRLYLVALGAEAERRWIVLDGEGLFVDRRDDVRDTASIVAMCELAGDLAGGGDLESLRSQLAQVRMVEQPPGHRGGGGGGARPRACDRCAAARRHAVVSRRGRCCDRAPSSGLSVSSSSPFSTAIRSASGTVDEFVQDVERGYLVDLR